MNVVNHQGQRALASVFFQKPSQNRPSHVELPFGTHGQRLGERALRHLEPEKLAQQARDFGHAAVPEDRLQLGAKGSLGCRVVHSRRDSKALAQQCSEHGERRRRDISTRLATGEKDAEF